MDNNTTCTVVPTSLMRNDGLHLYTAADYIVSKEFVSHTHDDFTKTCQLLT